MKNSIVTLTITTLSLIHFINSAVAKPIEKVGDMNVIATSRLGGNESTIVTITPAKILCMQASGNASNYKSCIRSSQNYKTTWNINCTGRAVHFSSKGVGGLHDIDPHGIPSQATFASYVIYDYACGTNYSKN